ncbi:MAG: DUF397 domain-containing protein [Streptosporangiales bacterium]|nr:DUF397 domain-containing protein [Streptosporangiales bacterium]
MKDQLYALPVDDLEWRKSSFSNPDNCVEVAHLAGGAVALRDSKNPGRDPLRFTTGEWDAFVRGAQAGEFS